ERGVVCHTYAVQWFGKEPFKNAGQFNADLVSACAHKFHGPKGAGLLYIKSPLHPDPVAFGGGHENERRAGTENLAGIIGLVWAMEKFVKPPVFERAKLEPLAACLAEAVVKIEVRNWSVRANFGWPTRLLLSFAAQTASSFWRDWTWKVFAHQVDRRARLGRWN